MVCTALAYALKIAQSSEQQAIILSRLKKTRELSGYGGVGGAVELCKELGYKAPNMMSKFENGGRVPLNVLAELAKAYGTTTDYLLGLTDSPDGDAVTALKSACTNKLNTTIHKVLEQLLLGDYHILKDVPPIATFASEAVSSMQKVEAAMLRFEQLNPQFKDELRGGANLLNSIEQSGIACTRLKKAIDKHHMAVDYRFSHAVERSQKSTGQFDLFAIIGST